MNPLPSALEADLADVEAQVAALVAPSLRLVPDPAPPAVLEVEPGGGLHQRAIIAALAAVAEQQPGAWLPVHQIADYIHDRAGYRGVQQAAGRLVGAGRIESITVAFDQTRRLLLRAPAPPPPDIDALAEAVNALLGPVGYRVSISPARLRIANFTPVAVDHEGNSYQAWRFSRPYAVALAELAGA